MSDWFAVMVKPNMEKPVTAILENKGYESFLPLYRVRRRWSDREKDIDLPLFTGYTFCRFDAQQRLPILTTPGVVSVVGVGKSPIPVDEFEMQSIRNLLKSGLPAQPWPYLKDGDRVTLRYGAFDGFDGILIQSKGRYRVVVSLSLLQRSVAVEVDRDMVQPARLHAARLTA